jgi:hypothetical protein
MTIPRRKRYSKGFNCLKDSFHLSCSEQIIQVTLKPISSCSIANKFQCECPCLILPELYFVTAEIHCVLSCVQRTLLIGKRWPKCCARRTHPSCIYARPSMNRNLEGGKFLHVGVVADCVSFWASHFNRSFDPSLKERWIILIPLIDCERILLQKQGRVFKFQHRTPNNT